MVHFISRIQGDSVSRITAQETKSKLERLFESQGYPEKISLSRRSYRKLPMVNRSLGNRLTFCRNELHHCVAEALEMSLDNLKVEYVDLYLLHWPQAVIDGEHPGLLQVMPC